MTCIFCDIAAGTSPAHKVWENDLYLAFLSIFPNTPGVTVVVPKAHYGSYLFDAPKEVMHGLLDAVKRTALQLDSGFPDVGRTGVVFEGFGVDHLHAKLFPLHGTKSEKWKKRSSNVHKYFDEYEGYISSHDYTRANDAELESLARQLRGESNNNKSA